MKKLILLSVLVPLLGVSAAQAKNPRAHAAKSKAAQAKVVRHHQSHWHQAEHGFKTPQFKCRDSWGHKLRGKFTGKQRYLIELGGGQCHKQNNQRVSSRVLDKILTHHFALSDVKQAIRNIKHQYGLTHARLVKSNNVYAGKKNFKYTLVFQVSPNHYREFRVKHNRRNGKLKQIAEV